MEVQIYFRVVYGLQKIYPANETARKFAELLGVKTFNRNQLEQIKALGHQVYHVLDPKAAALASDIAAIDRETGDAGDQKRYRDNYTYEGCNP